MNVGIVVGQKCHLWWRGSNIYVGGEWMEELGTNDMKPDVNNVVHNNALLWNFLVHALASILTKIEHDNERTQ